MADRGTGEVLQPGEAQRAAASPDRTERAPRSRLERERFRQSREPIAEVENMFSQTVEYALRAMVQLAADAPAASTTKQIAEKTKVPSAYLAKVLQSMRRAGLVHSRRGVGGGVTLAHGPKEINLLEVIDAVEPLKRTKGKARGARSPLQRTLDEALGEVRKTFEAASLADMLPRRKGKSAARRRKSRQPRANQRA